MSAALTKAAQVNIVHRDIKPENILLSPTGEVKIADFGLARVMDPQTVDLTQDGLTVGTPLYMSPEQVEGKPLDHRSDLYACGATTFYMLVGRPPFQGDTPLAVAVQHLQTPPPPLQELRPDAPPELCTIVDRLLAKKPQDRYGSAVELLRDLRALPTSHWDQDLQLDDETLSLAPDATSPLSLDATRELQAIMQTQAVLRVRRRRPWTWPLALALSAIVGAALASITWSSVLHVAPTEFDAVEEKPTANEQYWHALNLNTEAAYLSVAKFHPPEKNAENLYYVRRAKQQLAAMYVDAADQDPSQLDRALKIYEELSAAEEQEGEFRAIGFAGQTIVYHRKKEPQRAREALESAMKLRNHLQSQMGAELESVARELAQGQPS
jgi:serine/threonine-protein kinase